MSAFIGGARPVAILAESDQRLAAPRFQRQAIVADIWPVPGASYKVVGTPWGISRLAGGPVLAAVWPEDVEVPWAAANANPYAPVEETLEISVTAIVAIQQMPPFDLASGLFRW